jgi:predicted HTH domain antitoxin
LTVTPPSVVGNGTTGATVVAGAKFVPNIEAIPRGRPGVVRRHHWRSIEILRLQPLVFRAGSRYASIMSVTLDIPDSVVQGLQLPEGKIQVRLRTELALALYAQGALSLGKAAELATMSRLSLGELVGQRGIPRHYGDADLAQDLAYARSE